MQRWRRAIIADVGHKLALDSQRIDARRIGRLVNKTALGQDIEEVAFELGHDFNWAIFSFGVRRGFCCKACCGILIGTNLAAG